jgi:hypothetical protein
MLIQTLINYARKKFCNNGYWSHVKSFTNVPNKLGRLSLVGLSSIILYLQIRAGA